MSTIPYQGDEPFYQACTLGYEPSGNAAIMTSFVASHEYAESVTDPYIEGGSGWYHESLSGEIADLCTGNHAQQLPNGAWVSELWDDYEGGCSVADASPPQLHAITGAVTEVVARGATLHGTVNPGGLDTHYYFEYSEYADLALSHRVPSAPVDVGSGTGNIEVSARMEEGNPATVYYWRVAAENRAGTTHGSSQQFTTLVEAPRVRMEEATEVTRQAATLHGKVSPGGAATKYKFEWGPTETYGSKFEAEVTGGSEVSVQHAIGSLQPGTLYHVRLTAENSAGAAEAKGVFETAGKPIVTSESPAYANSFQPELRATINPHGADTHYWFEYGTSEGYGTKVPATEQGEDIGAGRAAVGVGQVLKGLQHAQVYHFRVAATNEAGTTMSTDRTFETIPLCKDGLETCEWSAKAPPNPTPLVQAPLKGVSCPTSGFCLAVGRNTATQKSFAEIWESGSWKMLKTAFSGSEFSGEMKRVSCPSTIRCISIGASSTGGVWVWKWTYASGAWEQEGNPPPTPAGSSSAVLKDVSCSGESACTAVGSYRTETGEYKPLVERWNGSGWSTQSAPNPAEGDAREAMLGVSCPAANSCIAVGKAASKAVAETWSGSAWTASTLPSPSGGNSAVLRGVSCSSATSCMAVGGFRETGGTEVEVALAERLEAGSWSALTPPNPAESAYGTLINQVSCLSPSSCFAVGEYANSGLKFKAVAESWSGGKWTLQSTPLPAGATENPLAAVSCTSSVSCIAVGQASPGPGGEKTVTTAERYE
jgi:hypothetical protein